MKDRSDIAIEFVHVDYNVNGTRTLISDLNLAIRSHEILILLGRSGSGKTTTLKLINRLLSPTRGEVRVEGRATHQWDPIQLRRSIGYAVQEVGLFPHYTVEGNVALIPKIEGWDSNRIERRVNGDTFACRIALRAVCASAIRTSFRAVSGSELGWLAHLRRIRQSCLWMSLSERSIR